MFANRRRSARGPLIEALENRQLLSASSGFTPAATTTPATTNTTLTLSAHSSKLGQDVIAKVTVKDANRKVKPTGSIEFLDNGAVINGLSGALTVTLNSRGQATYDFGPGDVALFTGQHSLTAQYVGSTTSPASTSKAVALTVSAPAYTTTTDGLKQATVRKGSGKRSKAGNTVSVSYTGFLASNGVIFDYATGHGTGSASTLNFIVRSNPEAVITGFDEGVVGAKAGESKTLDIPASIGYGATANGSIPANSELIFIVTVRTIA